MVTSPLETKMTMLETLTQLRGAIAAGDNTKIEELLTAATEIATLVPEIAIYLDGGLIQEVSRANDAPFLLHIHDEDVEGTIDDVCEVRHGDGNVSEAIISSYDHTDGEINRDQVYWASLRNPVALDTAPNDNG